MRTTNMHNNMKEVIIAHSHSHARTNQQCSSSITTAVHALPDLDKLQVDQFY